MDLLYKIQKYQIKKLVERGWIDSIKWLNSDFNFTVDIASESYKNNDSYMWHIIEYFNDKVLENKKSEDWYCYGFYKKSKEYEDAILNNKVKEMLNNFSKNPELLVFPIKFQDNEWEIKEYNAFDNTDFLLYEKMLYDIKINNEDKNIWWQYFKKMNNAKDIKRQSIFGKYSNIYRKINTKSTYNPSKAIPK